ncbi:flagellar biosynthetic protein FliO [Pelagibacterium montanilacus]|uniref:flagellar biosynthetic protein FliO n=1 Tax=Pelagibacterium montanilacus TaxID=2185280 RepID=UPI000F8CEAA8|nr:flagellar biosynthetic protein FliO [Pelagibacterium montanilacus]
MGWLADILGIETTYLTAVIALGIVVVLIILVAWALKFFGTASRTVGRPRARRLTVVEAIPLDARRQALILRRDGVEHLIVTGGPNDLLVESGFDAPPQPAYGRPGRRAVEPQPTAEPEPDRQLPGRGRPMQNASRPEPFTSRLRPKVYDPRQLAGGNRAANGRLPGDSATTGYDLSDEDERPEVTPEPVEDDYDRHKRQG